MQTWGACHDAKEVAQKPSYQALQKFAQKLGMEASSSECMELELHLRCPLREGENRKESALEKKEQNVEKSCVCKPSKKVTECLVCARHCAQT